MSIAILKNFFSKKIINASPDIRDILLVCENYFLRSERPQSFVGKMKTILGHNPNIPKLQFSNNWSVNIFGEVLQFTSRYAPEKAIDLVLSEKNKNNKAARRAFNSRFYYFIPHLAYIVKKYKWYIDQKISEKYTFKQAVNRYLILRKLVEIDSITYSKLFNKFLSDYLAFFTGTPIKNFYGWEAKRDISINGIVASYRMSLLVFRFYEELLPKEAFLNKLKSFSSNTFFFPPELIPYIKKHLGKDAMPYLAKVFVQENRAVGAKFYKTLFEQIDDLDWFPFESYIWSGMKGLSVQEQAEAAKFFASKPEESFELAKNYLNSKQKEERQLAFFTLAQIENKEAAALVENAFQKEKVERVREVMKAAAVRRIYPKTMLIDQVQQMIDHAAKRGKLKKWTIKNFAEADLPKLFLKTGEELTDEQVRFLFYRMKQIKTMQSDPEAKFLLNLIDPNRSVDFAQFILEGFLNKGAEAKDKYIMCLAGLLGDDRLLDYLQKLFKKLFDAKRMKMAQYVIGTIALIGSDKALRFIEYVSRKYKRKESLVETAEEALEIAAAELGIDLFELSDRIIPDFGFDGLYKTIEIGEEEMRVFVANDFKLRFITEDNKIRKSIPKAASKALKEEMKIIQKEIREVNKAQKDRLEQYMVMERKWTIEDWQKFYLNNPVMFIYAASLVWGVFDENQKLIELFYVDESASILNIKDDELELEEKHFIGIVHPLRITEAQITEWNQQFFELEIQQPFLQLNRSAFTINSEEQGQIKILRYEGKKPSIVPRAVQGYFEKRGWRKQVEDAGCFTFTKTFKQEGIYAHMNVEGLCVGWYDGVVIFWDIRFLKIGTWSWKAGIELDKIPVIAFSEVIMDMEGMPFEEETDQLDLAGTGR